MQLGERISVVDKIVVRRNFTVQCAARLCDFGLSGGHFTTPRQGVHHESKQALAARYDDSEGLQQRLTWCLITEKWSSSPNVTTAMSATITIFVQAKRQHLGQEQQVILKERRVFFFHAPPSGEFMNEKKGAKSKIESIRGL